MENSCAAETQLQHAQLTRLWRWRFGQGSNTTPEQVAGRQPHTKPVDRRLSHRHSPALGLRQARGRELRERIAYCRLVMQSNPSRAHRMSMTERELCRARQQASKSQLTLLHKNSRQKVRLYMPVFDAAVLTALVACQAASCHPGNQG